MPIWKAPARGSAPDRLMRDALVLELQEEAEEEGGYRATKLRLIARRLIDKAVGGDAAAIKEICDRIDGRAPQAALAISRPIREEESLEDLA